MFFTKYKLATKIIFLSVTIKKKKIRLQILFSTEIVSSWNNMFWKKRKNPKELVDNIFRKKQKQFELLYDRCNLYTWPNKGNHIKKNTIWILLKGWMNLRNDMANMLNNKRNRWAINILTISILSFLVRIFQCSLYKNSYAYNWILLRFANEIIKSIKLKEK